MSVRLQNFGYDEMNLDIYKRNVPSEGIATHFDPRPVNTKYRHLPVLDPKQPDSYEYRQTYNESVFLPGNRKPHYNGFANNVDRESSLRNQFFALQKGDQHLYVPSSNSNMYNHPINFVTHEGNINRLGMFYQSDFDDFNPNLSDKIGRNIFHNNTRVQLKDL